MQIAPSKAIIAVAGYGTRRLPVAKAVEKCMLPLLNRPIVDYIVEDLIKAGVTDIYFVVSGDAAQLRHYYSRDLELETYLTAKGKNELVEQIVPPSNVTFHYVEQDRKDRRYGTSVPLWLCRDYIRDESLFYYIGGDQTLWREDEASECRLLYEQVTEQGTDMGFTAVEVPLQEVSKYGVVSFDESGHFKEIIEHPSPENAPSNLNSASIYLFPGLIAESLERQMAQPKTGEYYIYDAIYDFMSTDKTVAVRTSDAVYLDCGSLDTWVRANNYLFDKTIAS